MYSSLSTSCPKAMNALPAREEGKEQVEKIVHSDLQTNGYPHNWSEGH